MISKNGKYKNIAEPFHCDLNKELFVGHLGNHLLNAADFHSNDRGFGMLYLQSIKKTWVLSRLVIEMEKMPKIYEEFSVETWVDSAIRYFTNRNFRIEDKDGSTLGYGRSVWAMIDTESRRPVNILDIRDGDLANWIETEKTNPIDKISRVKMSGDEELVREYVAQYSDIDINGHVNSVKYMEHILDLIPTDIYKKKRPQRFDIAYVAESYSGDILRFYKEQNKEQNDYMFRINKLTPNGEEVECVRSQIKFINR